MVGFSQQTYSINEEDESGDGSVVEVCLTLTGNLERNIAVSVSIIDGSAGTSCNWQRLKKSYEGETP